MASAAVLQCKSLKRNNMFIISASKLMSRLLRGRDRVIMFTAFDAEARELLFVMLPRSHREDGVVYE